MTALLPIRLFGHF